MLVCVVCALGAMQVGQLSCHGTETSRSSNPDKTIRMKPNQDAGCILWPLHGHQDRALMCVLDGHGEHGHHVAQYCMRAIAMHITAHEKQVSNDPEAALKQALVDADGEWSADDSFITHVPARTRWALKLGTVCMLHTLLPAATLNRLNPEWGEHGGSTAVVLLMMGKRCYIANSGDSRLVVARKRHDGSKLEAKDLTVDHTAVVPSEQKVRRPAGIVRWCSAMCS